MLLLELFLDLSERSEQAARVTDVQCM